jgi:hypothetical protein
MKKYTVRVVSILLLVLLTGLNPGLVSAGETGPTGEGQSPSDADVQNYFPVQGRLTDASGIPLNGDYEIAFRLYDAYTGGTALCLDTNLVKVVNGLFSTEVWGTCAGYIKGKQLYLSIEVEGNGEMDPRQPIFAVPYAWSLRPGAVIIGTVGPDAMLHIENWDPNGRGLRAYEMSPTGTNYGIVGAAKSPDGFGAYIYNDGGGVGLRADSNTGAAIKATGSGIIQSSALSYVWISGNGVRPYFHTDSTLIDLDNVGGAKVIRGGTAGTKNVMLPITITSPLYGQNVTLIGLDIYYVGDTATDGISAVLLRRQTGVCGSASCFANILYDDTDTFCEDSTHATGCTRHWDSSLTNNVLSADSGILYLTIELTFSGAAGWVDIGGVRLTLKHQ